MKVVKLDPEYYPGGQWGHHCPACGYGHEINVDTPDSGGAQWIFNGDKESPSFTPSVNLQVNPPGDPHYQPDVKSSRCHYFITAGKIIYLGDCSHALAGQTVDLPDLPPGVYLTSQHMALREAGKPA